MAKTVPPFLVSFLSNIQMAFCEVNFSLFGYSSPLFNSNIGGKLIGDEVFSTTVKEVKKLHIMFKELKEFVQYTKFHEQRKY